MKEILKKVIPVSILGVIGIAVAGSPSDVLTQGPACVPRDETLVTSKKEEVEVDERVYYVGCGGLF